MNKLYRDYDFCMRKICTNLKMITNSPSHLLHARNTMQWCETLISDQQIFEDYAADGDRQKINFKEKMILNIAAFANDLQYATSKFGMRIFIDNYKSYKDYRIDAHKISADFFDKIVTVEGDVDCGLINLVKLIVANHEQESFEMEFSKLSNILKDADALSYFDVLATFDFERCYRSKEDISRRFEYEYRRLSSHANKFILCFNYSNDEDLNSIMQDVIARYKKEHDSIDYSGIKNINNRVVLEGFGSCQ